MIFFLLLESTRKFNTTYMASITFLLDIATREKFLCVYDKEYLSDFFQNEAHITLSMG